MSQFRFPILLLLVGAGGPRTSSEWTRRRCRAAPTLLLGLLAGACGLFDTIANGTEPLEFDASAELQEGTVRYGFVVRNPTLRDVELTWGYCVGPYALRVYDAAEGALRWDESRWVRATACADVIITWTVPGQGEQSGVQQLRVADVLGDSLPGGFYRLAVMPTFVGYEDREVSVGEFLLVPPVVVPE